jgi:hypothetical protein
LRIEDCGSARKSIFDLRPSIFFVYSRLMFSFLMNACQRVFRNASQTPSPAPAAWTNRAAFGRSASVSMKLR